MNVAHFMPFGAQMCRDGVRFRLWAPDAKRVELRSSRGARTLNMDLTPTGDGWFERETEDLQTGAAYRYRIDDELDVPDPASRFNPQGVEGPSVIVDGAAFDWDDDDWPGRPWSDAVLYELHIGAFTSQGVYASATERLDELARLGVTALELMPLATFAGRRGWGYDGVLCYAPHPAYGSPEDLKRFIQAAHRRGLMVLLDVVYNHFGPQGNYLPRYASPFFTSRAHTPWGDAIDLAHPVVRTFFIENALYWLEEYRFDGLRLDAVHAMFDDSPVHFVDELIARVQAGPGAQRRVHVVLENHRNEARRLRRPHPVPPPQAGEGTYSGPFSPLAGEEVDSLAPSRPQADEAADSFSFPPPLAGEGREGAGPPAPREINGQAQWNDDFHHCLHVILTGESDGYYIDYADCPIERLGRVLTQGFAYQGERSAFSGEPRGEPSAGLPPNAFVSFLQNHDQVGNRALGERIASLAPAERLRAAYTILLLSPQIPMLFMGEEYAASESFLYFCDYHGELAAAVRRGRRDEFARFSAFADERARTQIPDPNDAAAFLRSRLHWRERSHSPHAERLDYVRELLRTRARCVCPRAAQIIPGASSFETHGRLLGVRWPLRGAQTLVMLANFADTDAIADDLARSWQECELLCSSLGRGGADVVAPWEVRLLLAQP